MGMRKREGKIRRGKLGGRVVGKDQEGEKKGGRERGRKRLGGRAVGKDEEGVRQRERGEMR